MKIHIVNNGLLQTLEYHYAQFAPIHSLTIQKAHLICTPVFLQISPTNLPVVSENFPSKPTSNELPIFLLFQHPKPLQLKKDMIEGTKDCAIVICGLNKN